MTSPFDRGGRRPAKKYKTGDVVGLWTLLEYVPGGPRGPGIVRKHPQWKCRCECGLEKLVFANHLGRYSLMCIKCANDPERRKLARTPATSVFDFGRIVNNVRKRPRVTR